MILEGIFWKRWELPEDNQETVRTITEHLGIDPLIVRVMVRRGITTVSEADKFWNPSLSLLHSPSAIEGMDRAIERIRHAVATREPILCVGDYDADGICGTALLVKSLSRMDARISYYIPHRLEEGYGINTEIIRRAHNRNIKLIITVDNGVSSIAAAELAKELGIDMIITDHHEPESELPKAFAILNPKLKGSAYPFRELSGTGVAFKLVTELIEEIDNLELVALGTVADIVPLVNENRCLVAEGITRINKSTHPGIISLIEISGLANRELTTGSISYQLAPRINAVGRLGRVDDAVALLLASSWSDANESAKRLDARNRERQKLEDVIFRHTLEILGEGEQPFEPIILSDRGWHQGVIGIVASKLVEKYNRPVILIAVENGVGKGSGRSIHCYNMYHALTACREHLIGFGGHQHAAGLSIAEDKIAPFKEALTKHYKETVKPEDTVQSITIDAEVPFSLLTMDLVTKMQGLAPYGMGNPAPVFLARGVKLRSSIQEVSGGHLKFALEQDGAVLPVISFKKSPWRNTLTASPLLDVVYTPQINAWNGKQSVQLVVRDWAPHRGEEREKV